MDIERVIRDYALKKYSARLCRAVELGILEPWQMDALIQMWHEEHVEEDIPLWDLMGDDGIVEVDE